VNALVSSKGLLQPVSSARSVLVLSGAGLCGATAGAEEPEQTGGETEGCGHPGGGEKRGVDRGGNAVGLSNGHHGSNNGCCHDGGQNTGSNDTDGCETADEPCAARSDAGTNGEHTDEDLKNSEASSDDVDDLGPLCEGRKGAQSLGECGRNIEAYSSNGGCESREGCCVGSMMPPVVEQ